MAVVREYLWTYREPVERDADIVGFDVEATDGKLGKIDEASYDAGSGYIVVDTSSWKNAGLGKQSLLPAGVIDKVDVPKKTVHVDVSKDEIKDAPEFLGTVDTDYRESVNSYYAPIYPEDRVVERTRTMR